MTDMTTKVVFDKHDGLITVTDRSKKWVISKDEAKSVFITSYESPKLITKLSILYSITAIITFGAITYVGNFVNKYYQVKLLTKSGKELKLLKTSKKEMADDLVKRISYLSTISNEIKPDIAKSNAIETDITNYIKADKSPGNRSKIISIYAGLLMICMGVLLIIPLILRSDYASEVGSLTINITGIVAIIVGVCVIIKKTWWLAFIGTICVIGFILFCIILIIIVSIKSPSSDAIWMTLSLFFPLFLSTIALIYLLISRKDFSK